MECFLSVRKSAQPQRLTLQIVHFSEACCCESRLKLGCLTSLKALFIPPLIYLYTFEYIYMYTVYTYLRVDIYECTSNVAITCSIVSVSLNIMLYL